jgi:hypothetical protein
VTNWGSVVDGRGMVDRATVIPAATAAMPAATTATMMSATSVASAMASLGMG